MGLNVNMIKLLLLTSIGKIEDSEVKDARNITNKAKRSGQNNNRSL